MGWPTIARGTSPKSVLAILGLQASMRVTSP